MKRLMAVDETKEVCRYRRRLFSLAFIRRFKRGVDFID